MLAWLRQWFGGGDAPKRRAARSSPATAGGAGPQRPTRAHPPAVLDGRGKVANDVAASEATRPAKPLKERYFDKLVQEAGELAPLSPAEEMRTSELVGAVLEHLKTHAMEAPVMPALASRMLELLRAESVDVIALARLIEQDQATAAKLLTIANSAVFRGSGEIGTVRDAVVFLGTEEVARVAIGLASRAMFEGAGQSARFNQLFLHAMTTAFAACQLATLKARRHADGAFMGGLFHDVGKSVALRAMMQSSALTGKVVDGDPVVDAALHQLHSEPSFALYQRWKLPKQLMTICRAHHRLTEDASPELHYVRLVSGLDLLAHGTPLEKREVLPEIEESAAMLKMTDPELRVAHTETKQYAEKVRQMFG